MDKADPGSFAIVTVVTFKKPFRGKLLKKEKIGTFLFFRNTLFFPEAVCISSFPVSQFNRGISYDDPGLYEHYT